jgi:hypothetical protein
VWDREASAERAEQEKGEQVVLPLSYSPARAVHRRVMRHGIALNGAHFNTQRMLQGDVVKACFD